MLTPSQTAFIRSHHHTHSIPKLMEHTGATRNEVRRFMEMNNLPWLAHTAGLSDTEKDYIRSNHKDSTVTDMSIQIDKAECTIRRFLKSEGLIPKGRTAYKTKKAAVLARPVRGARCGVIGKIITGDEFKGEYTCIV